MADKNKNTQPLTLRIRKRGEIGLSKSVMRALGCPQTAHFWWSGRENALLISGTEQATPMSVQVRWNNSNPKNGAYFTNRKLLKAIHTLVGTEDGIEYRLTGEFIPEINMVAFKTRGASREVISSD